MKDEVLTFLRNKLVDAEDVLAANDRMCRDAQIYLDNAATEFDKASQSVRGWKVAIKVVERSM